MAEHNSCIQCRTSCRTRPRQREDVPTPRAPAAHVVSLTSSSPSRWPHWQGSIFHGRVMPYILISQLGTVTARVFRISLPNQLRIRRIGSFQTGEFSGSSNNSCRLPSLSHHLAGSLVSPVMPEKLSVPRKRYQATRWWKITCTRKQEKL